MSDIRFACPRCQQHIQAETNYAGVEIACPSCHARMIVPGQPVAAATSAAIAPPPVMPSSVSLAAGATTAPAPRPPVPGVRPPAPAKPKVQGNLGLGILGAFLGAGVGIGVMYAFYSLVGFRFPLLGVGTGILTALGARILFKGGDDKLGIIASGLALMAVVATLYLMYGEFPIVSIISVVISASMAYKIASG